MKEKWVERPSVLLLFVILKCKFTEVLQSYCCRQDRIEKLLGAILPKSIAEVLQQDIDNPNRPLIAEGFKDVTILFADIVGFTSMSSKITPRELIFILNTIFSEWDSLCEKHHLEKIKTVGGKE